MYDQARDDMQGKLDSDKPESVWMALDGWSAITTSYIGAEICMYLFSLYIIPIYLHSKIIITLLITIYLDCYLKFMLIMLF